MYSCTIIRLAFRWPPLWALRSRTSRIGIAIAGGVLIHEKFQESLQIDPRDLPCSGAGAEVDTGVDLRIPHRHGRKTRQQAADSPGPGVHGVLL